MKFPGRVKNHLDVAEESKRSGSSIQIHHRTSILCYLQAVTNPTASLYVHVPFCAHKCEYCAFYSHLPGEGLVQRYVDSLVRELEMLPRFRPETIFFGGGTPSIL